eukprot:Gb_40668 [translate_table: standard]
MRFQMHWKNRQVLKLVLDRKMSFENEQSVLHVKSNSVGEDNKTGVDTIMEDDMEVEDTQGGANIVVAKQIDQDVEGCGISVYSKSSYKVLIEDRDEDTESSDFVNDIQNIVTVKREDMELEITAGPGEKRHVK